jgi:hypothetical protein
MDLVNMIVQPPLKKEETSDEELCQEAPLESETSCKVKPRAIILRARDKDFDKVRKLIKNEFPEVEIIYITTGPTASILRVVKSLPLEKQDSSAQPFYSVE